MRVIVLGAGATGGYFGGRLLEAGADVSFLVRPARAAQLGAQGLRIMSPDGDASLKPALIVTDHATAGDAGRFDCALLACKAYDLDEAMATLGPYVGSETMVLPLLNGLRHLERLDAAFGAERVLGGLCQISATLDSVGTIQHLGIPPRILFGERAGGLSPRVEALAATMKGAKFEARASDDIMQDMWEKVTLLSAMAASTCLMRAPIGSIVSSPGGPEFMRSMVAETVAIATAAGHAPRAAFHDRLLKVMSDPGSKLAASMLRDIERGGLTEGDHILGDMVKRARAFGVEAPNLERASLNLAVYERRRLSGET
jgi:2-dehydropantoate 2-reductase